MTLMKRVITAHRGTTIDMGVPIHNLLCLETPLAASVSSDKGANKDKTHCSAHYVHLLRVTCP